MKKWLTQRFPDRVWDNIATVSILGMCAVLGLFGYLIVGLVHENQDRIDDNRARIADIQQSRIESCRKTYGAIEDVALFFFPPKGKRDARQRSVAIDLHDFIATKKAGCGEQIRPKEKP